MSRPRLSILICARDAAATVGRAVASALLQGSAPVLVVDDWSSDDTASRAREPAPDRVKIVRPAEHRALGFARQTAVDAADTEWIMWIDADDEALPGRADAMLAEAERSQADIVFDDAELHDGQTGARLKGLPVPEFLRADSSGSRQFERNYIPSLGWGLMRTSLARKVGYDPEAHGVEDFDFCLRAIRAGARFAFHRAVGYRQYAYPTSISRDMYRRRADLVRLYEKHAYEDIRGTVLGGGWSGRVASWVLVSVAVFRGDYAVARTWLDELASEPVGEAFILEPSGPLPVPECWRVEFQRGTLFALASSWGEAVRGLQTALEKRETAEGHNNLGVALRRLGREVDSRRHFEAAVHLFPGYVDALRNLAEPESVRLTPLPLRVQPSRNVY